MLHGGDGHRRSRFAELLTYGAEVGYTTFSILVIVVRINDSVSQRVTVVGMLLFSSHVVAEVLYFAHKLAGRFCTAMTPNHGEEWHADMPYVLFSHAPFQRVWHAAATLLLYAAMATNLGFSSWYIATTPGTFYSIGAYVYLSIASIMAWFETHHLAPQTAHMQSAPWAAAFAFWTVVIILPVTISAKL